MCARARDFSEIRDAVSFALRLDSGRGSRVASAFAPAPALNHAATAFAFVFAFAFAFASLLKPPPPRLGNDRRAKGDCPSQCRSRAVIGCTAFWNSFSLRPFKLPCPKFVLFLGEYVQYRADVSRFFAYGDVLNEIRSFIIKLPMIAVYMHE